MNIFIFTAKLASIEQSGPSEQHGHCFVFWARTRSKATSKPLTMRCEVFGKKAETLIHEAQVGDDLTVHGTIMMIGRPKGDNEPPIFVRAEEVILHVEYDD